MKKQFGIVSLFVCLCLFGTSALALDDSAVTALCDFESFETTDDLIFNWYVHPGEETSGELTLDTDGSLHGNNSLRFDYSLKAAQSLGKSWCAIDFAPDDTETDFGNGVKFAARADNHVSVRLCIIDVDYTYKQYYFDVNTEAKDYVIRWEDFQNIPGQKTFDPASSKGIVNATVVIFSDGQAGGFNGEGKLWFDDFCTFKGDDETTPAGKPLVKQAAPTTVTTTVTTAVPAAQTTAATKSSETDGSSASGTSAVPTADAPTAPANGGRAENAGGWWIFAVTGGVIVIGGCAAAVLIIRIRQKKEKT